ncbi:amino acid ABC transporter permease [Pusillimonas sp. SM2304]|uniref:amino acid ABC transporter permease n=1 Tax=Pusillimonas sp. SM2304 TaxID=3073241 RepID=UPI0028763E51|nr:amino acid ABC transporter permease [Pusillimonas sp. SM2304]MDS1138877.1 amino acid ABC transporter permease [Pusillimonas sp. SM2304]
MMDMVEFFAELYHSHGINLSIFYDSFDRDMFLEGIVYTAWLSVASIAGSLAVGALGAYLQYSGGRWANMLVNGYIHAFRNTPPLVQLYFFYFALGPTLSGMLPGTGPAISNVTWAIVSLTLYAGAFNVEIFRAGIEAVPASTIEAADALGMNERQIFRKIVLPLSIRISLTGLTNNLVNLIKTTTNAFAIAVPEILYASSQIWSESMNALEMMIVLLVFFMLMIGLFTWLMKILERATAVPGWGHA